MVSSIALVLLSTALAFGGWCDEEKNPIEGEEAWKDATYYFDGSEKATGWQYLEVMDDGAACDYWFYFGNNGKKAFADDGDLKDRAIDGRHYAFDSDGRMLSGWQYVGDAEDDDSDIALWRWYYTEEYGKDYGARKDYGWVWDVPSEAVDESGYNDELSHWYYLKSGGKPVHGRFETIKNKKYCFDFSGQMVGGIRWIEFDENGEIMSISQDLLDASDLLNEYINYDTTGMGKTGLYYFGQKEDSASYGAMKGGKQTVTIDGEKKRIEFKK